MRSSERPDDTLFSHFSAAVRNHLALTALVASAALTLFAATVCTPRFENNDDVAMNLIASGVALSDRPDEHLLYTNVLIGLPLKWLYTIAPKVAWYGIYQLAALTLAAAGIAYALLRVDPSLRRLGLVLLFFAAAVLPCLLLIQFTKTAFLASMAGLLLFLAPVRGAEGWPRSADIAAAGLLILGSLIRFDAFLLACAMAVPTALVAAYAAPKRAALRVIPVAAVVVVAVGLYLCNRTCYARDEWRDFYAYNDARANFTDYGRYDYTDETRQVFEAVGWAPVDVAMMRSWFFADTTLYSLTNLRQIATAIPPITLDERRARAAGVLRLAFEYPDLLPLFLCGACVALLTGVGLSRFILPAVLLVLAFGIMAVLSAFYWLHFRIAFPLLSGAVALAALRPGDGMARDSRARGFAGAPVVRFAALALPGVFTLWLLGTSTVASWRAYLPHQETVRLVASLNPRPDRLYVIWGESFLLEKLVLPLEDPAILRRFRCVFLSALLPTPLTERRLKEFDIVDLCRAIWERPDVIVAASRERLQIYCAYVRLHYGRELAWGVLCDNKQAPLFVARAQAEPETRHGP